MKTADFFFNLPEERIAQFPSEKRGQSRLMVLDRSSGLRSHRRVTELPELLEPGSVLVFNNSRVRKARLYGRSLESGAEVEFLLLDRIGEGDEPEERDGGLWKCMIQRARRRRPGSRYAFPAGITGEICGMDGEFRLVRFDPPIDDPWLEQNGHIPLPPYIKREDAPADSERYQTVYAEKTGSAAAPTAGLHFTEELLARLGERGIESAFVTLHVGLGTFLPVRTENIEDHVMHREVYSISEENAALIERARSEGRNIIAVGTTSVRTLESAWEGERVKRGEGATSIFIYPGYRFKLVDALFTNFHTPGSSLLMLAAAFAEAGTKNAAPASAGTDGTPLSSDGSSGLKLILDAYKEAVDRGYRFFSYGDAMLIR